MYIYIYMNVYTDAPGASDGKESAYDAGDLCSIPGLGRSQYSCLENSMDRAWQLQSSP